MTCIEAQPIRTPSAAPDAAIGFLVRLATALHRFGVPSNRCEPLLAQVAARIGLSGTFLVAPTSIQMSFETDSGPITRFARVEPGSDDLGKLAALDALAAELVAGRVDLATAEWQLDAILCAPSRFPVALEVFAFGWTSAIAARCFGGGAVEVASGGVAGLAIGGLLAWSQRRPAVAPILEGLAAFLIAFAVGVAVACGFPVSTDVTVLAGLIVLLPGLSLTVAVTELATRHLASGVARLAATAVSFGALGFGVMLARRCIDIAFGGFDPITPEPLPEWTLWFACALAPWGFAVILKAAPRDMLAIACSAPLAFAGARLGAVGLGPEMGAFVGSVAVTVTSNLLARFRQRPASVTLVPGILMLVPGALGFRSFASMISQDVVLGLEAAAQMATVAIALVGGMLLANVVVPARRAL